MGTYRETSWLVHAIATNVKQLRTSSELQPTVRWCLGLPSPSFNNLWQETRAWSTTSWELGCTGAGLATVGQSFWHWSTFATVQEHAMQVTFTLELTFLKIIVANNWISCNFFICYSWLHSIGNWNVGFGHQIVFPTPRCTPYRKESGPRDFVCMSCVYVCVCVCSCGVMVIKLYLYIL